MLQYVSHVLFILAVEHLF